MTYILRSEMMGMLQWALNEMLYLLHSRKLGSSPGHRPVLHLWVWESGPPQVLPPLEGWGSSHARYRRICPPSHVRLHVPQPLQGLQFSWAATQKHWKSSKQWHSSKKQGKTLSRNWKEACKSSNFQRQMVQLLFGLEIGCTSEWWCTPFYMHLLSLTVSQKLKGMNEGWSLFLMSKGCDAQQDTVNLGWGDGWVGEVMKRHKLQL